MKVAKWIILGLGCLATLGCAERQNRALLEQELRLYEDRIYYLQDRVKSAESSLESSKLEVEALQCELEKGPGSGSMPGPPRRKRPSARCPADQSADIKLEISEGDAKTEVPDALRSPGGLPGGVPGFLKPPEEIPAPKGATPAEMQQQQNSVPSDSGEKSSPEASSEESSSSEAPPFNASSQKTDRASSRDDYVALAPHETTKNQATQTVLPPGAKDRETILAIHDPKKATEGSRRVASIRFSSTMTKAVHSDSQEEDGALFTVLQAFDEQGRLVRAAGPIVVVAIDPTCQDASARVARWDFKTKQVAENFAQSGVSRGFHFDLRWPGAVPQVEELLLFARYTTIDGRKVETHIPIELGGKTKEAAGPFGDTELTPPPLVPAARRPAWSPYR